MREKNTHTVIFSQEGQIVISHDHLIGTQILTVQEARDMAKALWEKSDEAERQSHVRLN